MEIVESAAFGELVDQVKQVCKIIWEFRPMMEQMKEALLRLEPLVEGMIEQNPSEEQVCPLKNLIRTGHELIDKCLALHWLDLFGRYCLCKKLGSLGDEISREIQLFYPPLTYKVVTELNMRNESLTKAVKDAGSLNEKHFELVRETVRDAVISALKEKEEECGEQLMLTLKDAMRDVMRDTLKEKGIERPKEVQNVSEEGLEEIDNHLSSETALLKAKSQLLNEMMVLADELEAQFLVITRSVRGDLVSVAFPSGSAESTIELFSECVQELLRELGEARSQLEQAEVQYEQAKAREEGNASEELEILSADFLEYITTREYDEREIILREMKVQMQMIDKAKKEQKLIENPTLVEVKNLDDKDADVCTIGRKIKFYRVMRADLEMQIARERVMRLEEQIEKAGKDLGKQGSVEQK